MIELPRDFVRGITYEEYPLLFKEGEILGRDEIAARAGRHYSTVVYHLERCVYAGLLHKQYGMVGVQPGWLYALPGTMPSFIDYLNSIDSDNAGEWE